jgi:hypothetical protein
VLGGLENQDFLVRFYQTERVLSIWVAAGAAGAPQYQNEEAYFHARSHAAPVVLEVLQLFAENGFIRIRLFDLLELLIGRILARFRARRRAVKGVRSRLSSGLNFTTRRHPRISPVRTKALRLIRESHTTRGRRRTGPGNPGIYASMLGAATGTANDPGILTDLRLHRVCRDRQTPPTATSRSRLSHPGIPIGQAIAAVPRLCSSLRGCAGGWASA